MLDGLAHLAHPLDGDLPAGALTLQDKALSVLFFQHSFGVGTAPGVEIIRCQAAGRKARAAARLAHQQNGVRQPPGAQGRAQL